MRGALTLVVSLCLALIARADPPGGPYSYEIGGDSEIWYPSGDAEFCETDAPGISCFDTTLATDGTGAVSGTGIWHLHIAEADGDLPFMITGQLAGSTRAPRPKLAVQFEGSITFHIPDFGDVTPPITGTGKFTCKNPVPHTSTFHCSGHAKLCATILGRRKCFGGGGLPIDVGAAGGPWSLSIDLMTDPNSAAISGNGSATLANTTSQDYAVTAGKYNAKRDLSKLTLTPVDPLSKNKISISDGLVHGVLQRKIKFKVAGESGVYSSPP